MARVNRSDVIQKAVNDLALSSSEDKIPNETLDKIQLTYNLNKQFSSFVNQGNSTTSGNITINLPTLSTGSEIYLTNIKAGFIKDATCDIATGRITISVFPNESGISSTFLSFPVITLTADSQLMTLSFPYPFKLKSGSSLVMSGTFTAGVLVRSFEIIGFTTSSN